MAELRKAVPIEQTIAKAVIGKEWVVYAKRPFSGPRQVIEYLGRYPHKIAISNHRLFSIDNGKIRFKYKDYKTGEYDKVMELESSEFIQ